MSGRKAILELTKSFESRLCKKVHGMDIRYCALYFLVANVGIQTPSPIEKTNDNDDNDDNVVYYNFIALTNIQNIN